LPDRRNKDTRSLLRSFWRPEHPAGCR
jgi:hypothetical protein